MGQHQRLAWHDVCPTSHEVSICVAASPTCHPSTYRSQQRNFSGLRISLWYTGTTEHRMHYDSAYTKISANSGVDQGCPLSACGFSAVVDPVLRSVMAQLCTALRLRRQTLCPTWTVGTCGSSRNASYRQLLLSQQPPDQSIMLYSPPRHKCGKALARTPFHTSTQ